MTNLKSGLSGCKIELLNDNILRKHSSSKDYNDRLKIQVKKQSLFSHFILNNIDTPNILKVNDDSIFSFDMEYVCGYSFDEYFTSKKKAQKAISKYKKNDDVEVHRTIFYRDIYDKIINMGIKRNRIMSSLFF